jgi:hypothetical protein
LPLFTDIDGSEMKKISTLRYYQMGNWLGYLREVVAGKSTNKTYKYLDGAMRQVESIMTSNGANGIYLQLCQPAAHSLLGAIAAVLDKIYKNGIGYEITKYDETSVNDALTRFEHVLIEELNGLPTYYISKKRNYSTQGLIEHADNEFPEAVRKRLTEQTITDIKCAGRAIAFELGTASGIHSFRALEAVALDYLIKRNLTPPKRNLYTYFDMLQNDGADAKVIQIGQQLRSVRRNPLAHPEDNLDVDEAIEAFQLCTSAITALIKDMEKRSLFPS